MKILQRLNDYWSLEIPSPSSVLWNGGVSIWLCRWAVLHSDFRTTVALAVLRLEYGLLWRNSGLDHPCWSPELYSYVSKRTESFVAVIIVNRLAGTRNMHSMVMHGLVLLILLLCWWYRPQDSLNIKRKRRRRQRWSSTALTVKWKHFLFLSPPAIHCSTHARSLLQAAAWWTRTTRKHKINKLSI